ncbi:MAG: PAS-domain containing protein [Holosporales bacterium]|nr:PAS-domain containing protein [Holosporales bacterium]
MSEESQIKEIGSLLADSGRTLPLAYAAWRSHGKDVFLSDRMVAALTAPGNLVSALDFVKLMQRRFGQFLNTAVDRLLGSTQRHMEYKSTVTALGEHFSLNLIFESDIELYTLLIDKQGSAHPTHDSTELASLIDTLPVYIWREDRNMKITYCNKQYACAVESTQEDVVADGITLIPKRRHSYSLAEQVWNPPKQSVEYAIIRGDRRALNVTRIQCNERGVSTWIAIDTTDHESLQKEHTNYKKQIEEIFDIISVPIAIFDRDTSLVFANSAIVRLFHMSGTNIHERRRFSDIVDSLICNEAIVVNSSASEYKEKIMSVISTLIEPYYTSIRLRDGKAVSVTILPIRDGGLLFTLEDVSEKVNLEGKISSLESIHAEMARSLPDGIIIFGDDNKIRLTNKALHRMLYVDQQTPAKESMPPDSEGQHMRDFFEMHKDAFATGDVASDFFEILVNAATTRSSISDTIALTSGKTVRYFYSPLPEGLNMVTFTDITDDLSLSDAIDAKNQVVAQLSSLKETIVSKIACEFKTPLGTILGFVDILYNMYFGDLNEKQLGYCRELRNITANLTETVDAIIHLINIEHENVSPKFEETDLPVFLDKIIQRLANRAEDNDIKLTTNIRSPNASIMIDRQLMKNALSQLVSRAIKVSPRGGIVSVTMEDSAEPEEFIDVVVTDAGITVSSDDVEDYAKLMSGSNIGSIVGYGSMIEIILARETVELHKGKVTIVANDDSGTSVVCSLRSGR